MIDTPLSNFPLLLVNTSSDFIENIQPNGDDIVYTDEFGNKLAHEIELFNRTSGELVTWLNVTSLSNITNTTIFIYYGNPNSSNQQNPSGVWDNNYVMVQHLNETNDTLYDSTVYQNNGTSTGTTFNNSCKIDGGRQYDDDDYIVVDNFTHSSDELTAEAWVYRDNTAYINIFCKGLHFNQCDWILYLRTGSLTEGIDFGINNHTGDNYFRAGSTLANTWFYLTATYKLGNVTLYVNGSQVGNGTIDTSSINNNYVDLGLGNDNDGGQPWAKGKLDELRVSKTARNQSWISTSYKNQNTPETYISFSSQEYTNIPPIANFTYSPQNPIQKQPIHFNDTSIDPDGNITTWFWDFGDGNTSNLQNLTHKFGNYGNYTVTLNVTDEKGKTGTTSKEIKVLNLPPTANYTYYPINPTKNDFIYFNDISNDSDGTIISWLWDFDDGYISTKQNPIHRYSDDRVYNVTLTIYDDDGATSFILKEIAVYTPINKPPNTPTIISQEYGRPSTTYNFTFTATDPDNDEIWYYIDWGDGNVLPWNGPVASGESINMSHSWNKGVYLIKVLAKDVHDTFSNWSDPFLLVIEDQPPDVEITKPVKALYILNIKIMPRFIRRPLIIGNIKIIVDASDSSGIEKVEFYIDGKLKAIDNSPPYTYRWRRDLTTFVRHKHRIKVIAFDNAGNVAIDEILVRRFL